MSALDRGDLIRIALTPTDAVHAPADLGDAIARVVAETPQRRLLLPRGFFGSWLPAPSPSMVLATFAALLLIIGIIITVASRRDPIPRDLTMYRGGPERTGVMPGPGPAGEVSIAWQGELRGPVPVQVMPIVHAGLVIVADDGGFVTAFGETDGEVHWSIDVEAAIRSSPLVVDGAVVVGAVDGSLTAYELTNREVRWRLAPGGPINASLVAYEGVIYAGSDDGNLYAVAVDSGDLLATMPIGGAVTRGPAISAGFIYVGSSTGTLLAIDAETHVTRWSVVLGDGETGTPAVVGDTVYVPWGVEADEAPGDALALDVSDGSRRWSYEPESRLQVYVAAIGDDLIYLVSKDHFVYALDRASGTVEWAHDTGAALGALAGLVDGVLYVANDGPTVQALDALTGDSRWTIPVLGIASSPAVIGGRVFVATSLGKVVAIQGSAPAPTP
jgi:outer membrane protein assembly factor BamB